MWFFSSSPSEDFKGNAVMNLSTTNNTRIMKKFINNSKEHWIQNSSSGFICLKIFYIQSMNGKSKQKDENRLGFKFLEGCVSRSDSNASLVPAFI